MKRCFAQRPLPSMMMAMWRGTAVMSGMERVELKKGSAMEGSV
jgi:hypothetical protein